MLLPLRDLLFWALVPFLRTRGYSALPVHFLGKAATANLLYAFPLLLLGDGEGTVAHAGRRVRLGVRDLGDRALLVGRVLLYAWQVRTRAGLRRRDATEVGGSPMPDSEHPQESAGEQPRAYVGLLTDVMTNIARRGLRHVAEQRRRTGVTPPTAAGTRMAVARCHRGLRCC